MVDRLRVTELDFDTIKQNLKTFLNQQSEFTDYDFEGSGLSVLLDILAYNTHYQAYYLNMIANEAFMDTALLRDSVISHAKTLGYVPYSRKASRATINFTVNTTSNADSSLTIPKGYRFLSNDIDGVSYGFVTLEQATVTKSNTNFEFIELPIYEGQLTSYTFNQNNASNPKQIFTLPDSSIDISTITVSVQSSSSNTDFSVYTLATDSSETTTESFVFFIQESKAQQYQIYFGGDIIGKKIPDGAVVTVTYLVTNADLANKANNFVATSSLSDSLGNSQSNFVVGPISAAAGGAERESVDNIKFSAPLQFTTQNRLVTFKDYESYIKKAYPSVDSVSVWGGEDETPPTFGNVYLSLKPKEGYYISDGEKRRIIDEIIKPKSIVTVNPIIRDPEFLYLVIEPIVSYDQRKTTLTEEQLKTAIKNAVLLYKTTYLDKFDSKLIISKLQDQIDSVDTNSIIGSEVIVRLQKRFKPVLNESRTYLINFNAALHRGTLTNRLSSTLFKVNDINGFEREVQFEEIPQSYTGISSISIINPGSGYISEPTVTITGDGSGATAKATIVNGSIQSIEVVNRGIDYTRALVTITGGGGYGASAAAEIDSKIGNLRTVYYDDNSQKQIVDEDAATIDYTTGKINITDIKINSVSSTDGYVRLTIESEKGIVSTVKNTIITLDENDPAAIATVLEIV